MPGKDDILYTVGIDNSDVKKKNKETKASIDGLGSSGKKSFGALNAGSAVAVAGMAAVGVAAVAVAGSIKLVSDGIDDFYVQAGAENRLDSVLKSTKEQAGLTAFELTQMSSALQEVTAVGDETTIAASSVLLTFTKIGKEVFPQTIEAAMNMSHIMGGDLNSNVKMVGKSLNDLAGAGLTAMTRAGVQFTDQQEEMIKTLAKSGREIEAQKIVLAELETQFGGAARNFRNTAEGVSISISNIFGDLSESVGEGFFDESLDDLQGLLQSLTSASPELASLAKSFGSIAGSLASVPINALTGWVDLFHAYSAGNDASLKNPLLKNQAEASTELNKAIESSISPIMEEEVLGNYGGLAGIRSTFLSAEGGNVESLRTISSNKELQAVYDSTIDETKRMNDAFAATRKAVEGGTLNGISDQETKDKDKDNDLIATAKVKFTPFEENKSYSAQGTDLDRFYANQTKIQTDYNQEVLDQRAKQHELELEAAKAASEKEQQDQRDANEKLLQNQKEFYSNSTSILSSSNNAIIGLHESFTSGTAEGALGGASDAIGGLSSILDIAGLADPSGVTSIIGGALDIGSTIAGFLSDDSGGDSTAELDSQSRTTARANIVSNAPRSVEITNNITFAAPVIGEVATREFVLNDVVPYIKDGIESVL